MLLDKIFSAHRSANLPKEVDPFFWYPSIMMSKTAADQDVSEQTALTVSTYYACVRNLSEDTASLPLSIYRTKPSGGRERADDHVLNPVLKRRPNPMMTAWTFRSSMMANAVTWGNAYAEIVRDNRNRPRQLWPIHPSRVSVHVRDGHELYYKVQGNVGNQMTTVEIESTDMVHLKGLSVDGLEGISVLRAGAESVGIALAEQEFTGGFLGNGAAISGVLTHPKRMSKDALENLRGSWAEMFRGAANAGKPAILEEDMKWQSLGIPQRDAQFLEQRLFGVNEICRWFRMPPHKVQHLENATYSNIESQDRQYVNDTLMPWLVRFEEELTLKLFSPQEVNGGVFVCHKVEGRLRGDADARAKFYNTMLFIGAMTINEVRELENLNPIGEAGDVNFMQSAMTTVEKIIEVADEEPETPQVQTPPEPPEPDEPEETEDEESEDEAGEGNVAALGIILRSAAERVVRKTEKATCRDRDTEWLTAFYVTQARYLAQEVQPACEAFHVRFVGVQENLTREHFHDVDLLTEFLLDHHTRID